MSGKKPTPQDAAKIRVAKRIELTKKLDAFNTKKQR